MQPNDGEIITSGEFKGLKSRVVDGREIIVHHFFKPQEITIGSRWHSGSGEVIVDSRKEATNGLWYVGYSWCDKKGDLYTHAKDVFSFQCRYSLIVETLDEKY